VECDGDYGHPYNDTWSGWMHGLCDWEVGPPAAQGRAQASSASHRTGIQCIRPS